MSKLENPVSRLDRPVVKPHLHKRHVHLTEWQKIRNHFVSGAIALSSAFAMVHPIDTLKTRMQASAGDTTKVFNKETGRILMKGFMTSILGAGPQGGLRWATYEWSKAHLLKLSEKTDLISPPPALISGISAVLGDLASSIVKVPREIVTSRLQTGYGGETTARQVVADILKTEGPRGLFRGFWSITARDAPFMTILFVTYESFKAYSIRSQDEGDTTVSVDSNSDYDDHIPSGITTFRSTLYGGISGFFAAFFTTPFDVIRAKVMTSKSGPVTMSSVVRQIIDQERQKGGSVVKVFWTGAIPRSVWWFCICGMFFPTYERTKDYLRDHWN